MTTVAPGLTHDLAPAVVVPPRPLLRSGPARFVTDPTDDQGSVSVAGALFGIGIFTLIGLVLMHGQSLGALSRTREAADNAARAGAQQIDTDHLLATGEVRIDAALASDAVAAYAANLPAVSVTDVVVDGATITVTVTETVDPITGVGTTRTFTATESATALPGVTGAIE